MTDAAARRLLGEAGHDLDRLLEAARERDFEPVPLGIRTSFRLANEVRTVETANVLGRIPGRDPELADEYVVFSAHHDHLGIGKPNDEGDEIYNGALDNASGIAQVLAIGQALAELPAAPRRSILFAFVAAEEQGLLGSAWFAQNPTVAPGRMAANINYDGANIWGRTRDVTFVGFAKSSLGAIVEKFAAAQGRTVKPDQFPDKGSYYRSDQFNFAKIGVPAIYLGTGTEFVGRSEGWGKEQIDAWVATHYHQPSDELIDEWTFEGMVDDSLLGLMCAIEIAESDELPSWTPGDEFEAARQAALAAVAAGDA
jgi:Zn-dependent M28 family amino/carboxypeptidase